MASVVSQYEKRAEARLLSRHYLRVYHRMTDHLLGQLLDFSPRGFGILSSLPIVIGQSFELTLVPPEQSEYPAHINIRARSMWCAKDENPNYYLVGFSLLKAPNDFFVRVRGYAVEKTQAQSQKVVPLLSDAALSN